MRMWPTARFCDKLGAMALLPRLGLLWLPPVLLGCAAASAGAPATSPPLASEPPAISLAKEAPPHELKPSAAQPPASPEPSEPSAPAAPEPDPFLMSDAPPRCPPEMALVLGAVCVDRWESMLVSLENGEEKAWSPYQNIKGATVKLRAVSRAGVKPQGYISGVEAERACEASGKRLCTAREWEAACRGSARTAYPYGEVRRKRTCNDDGRPLHPVAEVTKRLGLPADRMWYEGMDHPLINQLDDTLRNTGELEQCTNDVGTFDMVGNLHEWIEDPSGTFRGGFYMDTLKNGEGCNYATTAHSKKYHDYSTGFRCCMDADPVE